RKLGPLLIRGFSHLQDGPGRPFVIEFRPYVPSKQGDGGKDARFYLTSTGGILQRLLRDLSFARLNEAVFNKFGICIDTGTCSVFVQAVCNDCIEMKRIGPEAVTLERARMSQSDWDEIKR